MATSCDTLGNDPFIMSFRSSSFSSMKCISLPPPLEKRKGIKSFATNPYNGSKFFDCK